MSGDKQLERLLDVLQTPVASRSDADVDVCHAYFKTTKFFRAIGRDSEDARECCKHLLLESFDENDVVCTQGDVGDCFYFLLEGSVRALNQGWLLGEQNPGDSFGEVAVLGRTELEQKHTVTVIANERTQLVSLHRVHYMKAVGSFTEVVVKLLKIPPMQRSVSDQVFLLAQFGCTEFFQKLYFAGLQTKCCKYMTISVFKRNQKIELNRGQKHLCILIAGGLTLSVEGKVVRSLAENDMFMGDSVAAEGGLLTGTKDGVFAVLSKQNYDEVTANSFAQIRHILSKPPQKRTHKELDISMEMFCHSSRTLPFFRALPSAVLRRNSCKMLGCREFTNGALVFREGDDADCLYIIINGTVVINGEVTDGQDKVLASGSEFGHFDGVGGITENKVEGSQMMLQRAATARVTSDTCLVATLAKPDFARLCQLDEIHIWVERFWKLITTKAPSNDSELSRYFDELDEDNSGGLERFEICKLLDSLGRKPSELQLDNLMQTMDPDGSGSVDFDEFSAWWWQHNAEARTSVAPAERPDMRAMFASVDTDNSGVIDCNELLEALNKAGVVKNEEDKAAVRTLFVEFDTDNSGELDYKEYCALTKKLQSGQSTLAMLDSQTAPSAIEYIEFKHYKLLHSRIAKSVAPDFTEEEAEVSGQEDWKEDLQRFGNLDNQLNRQQFGHSIFQLVDEWCGGASSTQMIVGWLRMLFSNIVDITGKLRDLNEIGCIDDDLNNMCEGQRQHDEREKKEAERRFKEKTAELKKAEKAQNAAQAKADKADKAKKAKEIKAQLKKEQKQKQENAAKARAEKARKKEQAVNLQNKSPKLDQPTTSRELPSHRTDRTQCLADLDSEEAELLRKLESGQLTAEEEAQIRTRLKALDVERKGLQAAAVETERALAALDKEEAELMRRLESGQLTAEEEADVRSRLAAIAGEREAVRLAATAVAVAGGDSVAVDQAKLASQMAQFDSQLSALDDEEAELLRRLEKGDLTPEEEAEVRAKLQAISAKRKEINSQRAVVLAAAGQQSQARTDQRSAELIAELAAVDQRLSLLNDEEAELMRRLQSGELSEQEARAVRDRLELIAKERDSLLEQRQAVTNKQAEHESKMRANEMRANAAATKRAAIDRKLAALDDEEAELQRRLASGKLSPAEAKAARARLDAIAAEKKALQLQAEVSGSQEGLEVEIAHLDAQLTALDDEEAELMRRLESGELSAEEEAQVRARLAVIAVERNAIKEKQQMLVQQQKEMNSEAESVRLELEIVRLKNQMNMLDSEEAALFRRLAMGDLSPDEEAEIRTRLAAIDRERATLQKNIERNQQLSLGCKEQVSGESATKLRRRMQQLRGVIHVAGLLGSHFTAQNAERHGSHLTASAEAAEDSVWAQGGVPLAVPYDDLERRARSLRKKRRQRRLEILEQARAASASGVQHTQHLSSTILFDTRRKAQTTGGPRGVIGPEKWYRWKETAERLDGGWRTGVVTESNRQNRRPSTAERQLERQNELQQSRSRRLHTQHLRQRSKVIMDTARSERRRAQKEYIAAKIATETKARRLKGFTLPTFGPRPPDTSVVATSRTPVPMSFMQLQRPGTSPEPSSHADIVHLFDRHPGLPLDSEITARIANPNLNQGRGSPRRPPSSIAMNSTRPNSVAW